MQIKVYLLNEKNMSVQPILHISMDELLCIFITKKYMADPTIFGLHDFSIGELERNLFEMTGDNFYCLYEKSYRLENSKVHVNVKNYFNGDEFISNGIDLAGGRICTALNNFQKKYGALMLINSVELLLDDSLSYGSLILNKFLEVRFGMLRRPKGKKKFHLLGISTDYECPSNGVEKEINTHGARTMKKNISLLSALEKCRSNHAIKELAVFVMKNFSHVLSPVEASGER